MIRNVVLGRVSDDPAARERVETGLAGVAALRPPGLVAMHVGWDVGLRDGGWSFAITNDWVDADAYRAYDLDAEHNVHRAMIVSGCAEVARVQFELPD